MYLSSIVDSSRYYFTDIRSECQMKISSKGEFHERADIKSYKTI